jgi:hypothetical protein
MKDNDNFTEVLRLQYRGFTYTIFTHEYGWCGEAYDEDYPIRVRFRDSLEQACEWMERKIDRWIDKERREHLNSIKARNEQMLFRTR